jgi:hypothetical protein
MASRNTLIWVGAAALVVVAAGAGAVVWTYPGLLVEVSNCPSGHAGCPYSALAKRSGLC